MSNIITDDNTGESYVHGPVYMATRGQTDTSLAFLGANPDASADVIHWITGCTEVDVAAFNSGV